MGLETTLSLSSQTIEALKELSRINIDSAEGFRSAADDVEDLQIKKLFLNIANEREQQSRDLQKYLQANHVKPAEEGSLAAALHRAWMSIRTSLSSDDKYAALAEAEWGEEQIKTKYEDILKETAGSAVNDVLLHQYAKVKTAHHAVRDMRDSHAPS